MADSKSDMVGRAAWAVRLGFQTGTSMCPPNPPSPAALSIYRELFVNRTDAYMAVGKGGHWICCKRLLSQDVLSAALCGRGHLGVYSVDERGLSRWVCLDLDDSHQAQALFSVIALLDQPECALLESSRRGFHLWLFVSPTPWAQLRSWGLHLARQSGLEGIEVFPKGPGFNGVRAPLTVHPRDGAIYPLIDPATGEIVTDPWALLNSRRIVRAPGLVEVARSARTSFISGRTGRTVHTELVAEIERYTELRFFGDERAQGRCPFHDDRHPSLGVIGGYWKCFAGCGSGGLAAFQKRIREQGKPCSTARRHSANP